MCVRLYNRSITMGLDEQRLVEGCKRGDNAARKELYDLFGGRLLSICLRYTGDRATAEDLLHDTFLKVFGAIERFSYRGEGSLRAWIERIAVNTALEYLRSRSRFGFTDIDDRRDLPDTSDPTGEEVERVPYAELLRMVGELPEGYRTVFNLYCIEGLPHREIATMLGINEKSSSSQLARAKAMLARKVKSYLEEKCYETR